MPESKFELRKKYRGIRAKIPVSYRREAALAAAKLWVNYPLFRQSVHMACYLSVKDEFDSSGVIEAIWQAKKYCYLPVLAKEEDSLFFVRYEFGDALHLNRYSILEPVNRSRTIPASMLDVVITPLIAFDLSGHRLGTGGGYYDRAFAFKRGGTANLVHRDSENEADLKKPHLLGLAYAVQEAKELPFDPWDVLLEGVITERGIINIDPSGW